MGDTTKMSGIVSVLAASATLSAGTLCVLDSGGKLVPWTSAAATDNKAKQVFFPLIDASESDLLVSAAVAGNYPGTVNAKAAAGTYAAGDPVYAGTNGDIAATGTRVVGTAAESVTLAETGMLEIVPMYVPVA